MYEVKVIREIKGEVYDELSFLFNEREKAIKFANDILSISPYNIKIKYYSKTENKNIYTIYDK